MGRYALEDGDDGEFIVSSMKELQSGIADLVEACPDVAKLREIMKELAAFKAAAAKAKTDANEE